MTSLIMTPCLSGVVTYTVLALSLSVFISVYHHPSLCLPSSSPSTTSTTSSSSSSSHTKHPVLFCTGPTFLISPFPPSSLSFTPSLLNPCFATAGGCSLSRSLSSALPCLFFFLNPFHFRAEILQSFTCLLDSSLPDFLLCFAPPCSTDL